MTVLFSRKRGLLKLSTALTTGFVALITAPGLHAQSAPLPQIAAGNTIVPGGTATDMTVDIGTSAAKQVITWESFGIASGNSVAFSATNSGTPDLVTAYAVLNRVIGSTASGTTTIDPSIIAGRLSGQSNVAIWLVNPAGITFSSSGSYNGGSLVLSTLDISDAQFNGGGSQRFTPFAFGGSTVAGSGATQLITLTGGDATKVLNAAGSILMVGEQIDVGKQVSASGDVGLVAAQDVTFTAGAQSPLSYTIAQGTSLSGVRVLGTGQVSGASITLAAVSRTTALDTLLDVASGATLSATAVNGVITLTTTDNGGNTVPQNGDGIRSAGTLTASGATGQVTALADGKIDVTGGSLAAGGAVSLTAGSNAAVRGAVSAGATYTVSGASVTLGGAVTQQAAGNITLTANVTGPTNGDASTETGLTLRSNGGAINVSADGNAVLRGNIDAATTYTVNATEITLGGNSQKSAGLMDINAGGALVTESGLTLQTTGAGADVDLSAVTTANLSAAVDAGRDYLVGAGTGIALGTANVTQKAGRNLVLNTAAGDISGAATMTLNGVTGAYLFAPTGAVKLAINSVLTGGLLGLDYAAGADITLGDVTGVSFGKTNAVGSVNEDQVLGSFIARDITLTAPAGKLSLTATTDIKGANFTVDGTGGIKLIAGGNISGLTAGEPINLDAKANALEVRADRLVQGGTFKGAAVTVAGGNLAASGNDGSVELGTVQASGNLLINAYSNSTANTERDGEIRLGKATVGGTTTLDDLAGTVGDIIVSDQIDSTGNVTINGVADLRLATFNAGTNAGRVRSSAGNVAVTVAGSVFGIAGTATAPGAGGVLGYEATGDLTVNSGAGADVVVNSLKAGGNLNLSIGGALAGTTASPVAVTGGAMVADGAGGAVSVTAGATGGAVQSILLDTVQASAITLKAEKVAVGTVLGSSATTLAIEDQGSAALGTSDFYVGLRKITGNATITFTGSGVGTNVVAADTSLRADSPEFLNIAFGKANLDAGGTITGSVTNGAQLGNVAAGGLVNVTAGGLVADSVQSTSGAVALAAGSGTLSLRQVNRANGLTLTKTGVSAADGDELRVRQTNNISGGATLDSSTNLRLGSLSVGSGNITLTVAADLSGVRLNSAAAALGDVTTLSSLDARYGLADVTASAGNVTFNNGTSHAQFGAVSASGDIIGVARAVTAGSLVAGGQIDVTANTGSLVTGSAQAGALVKLTKTGGSTNTNGDDLRVLTTGVGGTGVTLDSTTHVRVGTALTATTNNLLVRVDGDVSGLLGGTFQRLPQVTLGNALSAQYGNPTFEATVGNATVTANSGGVQLASLNAGTNGTVEAQALTVNSAGIGQDLTLTATAGTLDLGIGTVGRTSLLTKQGGTAASALLGDELRVGTLTGGTTSPGGITLLSISSVRAGGLTAQRGNVDVTATLGDVSGLLSGSPEGLANVTTGSLLSGRYLTTDITSSNANVTVTAARGAQLGQLLASGSVAVTAGSMSVGSAGGASVGLTATSGTLVAGSLFASGGITATKQGGSAAVDGDDLRVLTTALGGSVALNSQTSVRTGGLVRAALGDVTVNAVTGDVSGLLTGTFERLPLLTITERLSANYGGGEYVSQSGDVWIDAAGGGVQLTTVNASRDLLVGTVSGARAISLSDQNSSTSVDATAGRNLTLTASAGTLVVSDGTAGQTALLTKQGGNAATNGDDLRITALIGGTGVTMTSSTSLRVSTVTATTGNLTVTATSGDISGLLTGAFQRLPQVSTAASLSSNYGLATLRALSGNASATAASGGIQLDTLQASGNASANAAAISATAATATAGTLGLTASTGTLVLGTGTAGTIATITKQGGSAATNGDDLRVTTLTGGTGANLSSNTSLRIGSATANTGDLAATAVTGDISGLLTGTFERLPTTTATGQLSSNYGLARLVASLGTASAAAAAGGIQLATLVGGIDAVAGAKAITIDDGSAATAVDASAGRDLLLTANGGTLHLSGGTAARTATLTKILGSLSTVGDELRVGTITAGTATAPGGVGLASGTSVRAGTVTAQRGSIALTATAGDATGLAGTYTGTSATGFGRVVLTAATDVSVTAGGLVQAGTVVATGGAISIATGSATTNGSIDVSSLTSGGATALTAIAKAPIADSAHDGDILVGGATTAGGALLARNTGGTTGSISFGGSIDAASVTVNAADKASLLDRVTSGGSYTVTAGGDITLGAAAAVTQRANGAVAISTTGPTARIVQGSGALTLTANADGVGNEALSLSAPGGIALGNTALAGGTAGRQSAVTLTSTGGATAVNTVTGASLVSTSATGFTANGAITVGNAGLGADVASGPSTLDIRAGTGGITTQAITVTDAGHDLRLAANGAISTGALTAVRAIVFGGASVASAGSFNAASLTATAGSITGKAGTITVPGAVSAGSTLDLDATNGTASLATQTGVAITTGGDVTVASTGLLTLGALGAGARNVTLTTSDAAITGTITAGRITVVNRGPSGNAFCLGGATGTGFALDANEVNRLNAAAVVLDAGTGTGLTRQDVAIGDLALTSSTLRTLDILGLQRIDVTGAITKGASGLTAMRIGGTTVATDLASVLRVAANANGTGGRIDVDTASLDLRAVKIGVGQDAGFLQTLGVTAGSSASQTALALTNNPFSGLYSAGGTGGLFYTTLGQVLVKAASMQVSYTDFALFQNTQLPGLNGGVSLGSVSVAATPGLGLSGPAAGQAGPFGLFGTINGVADTATALLGPTTIAVTAVDRTSARINGCLIGSGAGCLNNVLVNPAFEVTGRARDNLLLPNGNFELPFDPLVGTNNDSLFGDVGSFGLSDIPLGEIDCDNAGCPTKKDAN